MGELAFNGFLLLSFVGLAVYSAQIPIQGKLSLRLGIGQWVS